MRTLLAVLVISSLVLSSCGRIRDSKANPVNWFGKSKSRPVAEATAGQTNPLIPEQTTIFRRGKQKEVYIGTPISQISSLVVEQASGGAVIRVVGLSRLQGAFDVRLTSETKGEPVDGILTFTLKALQPDDQPQGPQIARTIHAARFVSNGTLEGVTTIRVVGAQNVQTTRR